MTSIIPCMYCVQFLSVFFLALLIPSPFGPGVEYALENHAPPRTLPERKINLYIPNTTMAKHSRCTSHLATKIKFLKDYLQQTRECRAARSGPCDVSLDGKLNPSIYPQISKLPCSSPCTSKYLYYLVSLSLLSTFILS